MHLEAKLAQYDGLNNPVVDTNAAFAFYVNPLGVQMDLFLDDLGVSMFGGSGSEDPTWDAIWASAGRPARTR